MGKKRKYIDDSILLHIREMSATMDKIIADRKEEQKQREAERKEQEAKQEEEQKKRDAQAALEKRQQEEERKERDAEQKAREIKQEEERKLADINWKNQIKSVNKRFGEFSNSYGRETEVLFQRTINITRKVANISFDRMFCNIQPTRKSNEYDMILVNGEYVAIVEIKRSADMEDLLYLVEVQAKKFRLDMPEYKDKKLICVLAFIKCGENVIIEAKKKGVCILFKDRLHIKEEYDYLKEF